MKVDVWGRSWIVALALTFTASLAQAAKLPDFTDLVEEVSPAIVNISSLQNVEQRKAQLPQGLDPEQLPEMFKHFFGDQFNGPPGVPGMPGKQHPKSLGSGFVISEDGYILTNNHVVEGADEILVRFSDRSELQARLIGSDPRSDMALLKVDAKNLPTVTLGNSEELKTGEWVLAIGSPFGFDHTVTAGIVSATGRSLSNESYVPFIQTDVAINPGNSGGPLFNLDGEVVGINSQIYTRSGGFMGLSFSIPITMAMEVVEQLKNQGYVSRGWLGVYIQEVNKSLAESFGLEKPAGALVTKVMPESPAAAAGLKEGDVITAFNDEEIVFSSQLPQMVGRVQPGTSVELEVVREGKTINMDLTVGELPDEDAIAAAQRPDIDRENVLAIDVAALEPERKSKWQLSHGVVVRQVSAGPGANAGLLVGDVITSLNGEDIDSVARFHEVVSDLPKDKFIRMRIVRHGNSQYLALKIDS